MIPSDAVVFKGMCRSIERHEELTATCRSESGLAFVAFLAHMILWYIVVASRATAFLLLVSLAQWPGYGVHCLRDARGFQKCYTIMHML